MMTIKKEIELDDDQGQALQRQAVKLYQQYGLFLPGPAKDFFRKLAIHLQWQDLMKATK